MCQFFSAIVTKDSILFNKNIDQHEELVRLAKLDDTTMNPDFVRVEITPIDKDVFNHDPNNWYFIVDQDLIPDWFDKAVAEERTRKALKEVLKEICFIDCKDVTIRDGRAIVKNSVVKVYNKSIVYAYTDSIVYAYTDSTVKACDNSVVKAYDCSIVKAYDNSIVHANDNTVINAYDDSCVCSYDDSIVKAHSDSTVKAHNYSIVKAYDRSSIEAYDKSYINKISEYVKIVKIADKAIVRDDKMICVSKSSELIYSKLFG